MNWLSINLHKILIGYIALEKVIERLPKAWGFIAWLKKEKPNMGLITKIVKIVENAPGLITDGIGMWNDLKVLLPTLQDNPQAQDILKRGLDIESKVKAEIAS